MTNQKERPAGTGRNELSNNGYDDSTPTADGSQQPLKRLNGQGGLLRRWLTLLHASTDPALTRADVAVLGVVLSHINSTTGKAWPSYVTIATAASVRPNSIVRAIEKLERHGYLMVERGKGKTPNVYSLSDRFTSNAASANGSSSTSKDASTENPSTSKPRTVALANDARSTSKDANRTSINLSNEPEETHTEADSQLEEAVCLLQKSGIQVKPGNKRHIAEAMSQGIAPEHYAQVVQDGLHNPKVGNAFAWAATTALVTSRAPAKPMTAAMRRLINLEAMKHDGKLCVVDRIALDIIKGRARRGEADTDGLLPFIDGDVL